MTKHVSDAMTTEVVTVTPDTRFKTIVSVLESHHVNLIPVIDDERRVLGVVSEADLLAKVERADRVPPGRLERWFMAAGELHRVEGTLASEIMTRAVDTITPEMTVSDAAQEMTVSEVKTLPVVDEDERLIGIVSRTDLLKTVVREDASIQREVVEGVLRGALAIEPEAVAAVVEDGAVVLLGEVESRGLHDIIEYLVGAVPGVVSVVNRLEYRADGHLLEASRDLAGRVTTPGD